MDSLFFHPKLVHVPIALAVLMPLIAGALAFSWWRGWLPSRAWLLAIGLQAVLLGSGIVALQTGEAEEDRVENIVAESFIEQHEEAAEGFVWASGGVLAIMLLALALSSRSLGPVTAAAATVGTLVVFGLGYRTGQAGGDLVYRHGAAQAYVGAAGATGATGAPAESRTRKEDDD